MKKGLLEELQKRGSTGESVELPPMSGNWGLPKIGSYLNEITHMRQKKQ